ncbi:MAG TPA: four helix bundle protein [Usitatibacter sp.]|nr:four helix bundle protein [Usitatibacter sp.]
MVSHVTSTRSACARCHGACARHRFGRESSTVALDLIRQLRPIVEQIKMHDAHLADQLRRAATNTLANLAEGQRRAAGNKRRAYETAHGEAREMLGCLDCALAWGYATDDAQARVTLDRLLGLCWGLTH